MSSAGHIRHGEQIRERDGSGSMTASARPGQADERLDRQPIRDPAHPAGITRHFSLAATLNRRGHDVTLVASSFDHVTARKRG